MNTLIKYNKVVLPIFLVLSFVGWFGYSSCVQNSYSGKTALECIGWELLRNFTLYLLLSLVITNVFFILPFVLGKNIKTLYILVFQVVVVVLVLLFIFSLGSIRISS